MPPISCATALRRWEAPPASGSTRLPAELAPATSASRECAAAIEAFSLGVIEAVSGDAAAVKIQAACYERFGSEGYAAMCRVLAAARTFADEIRAITR
jgi:hypothetical protein